MNLLLVTQRLDEEDPILGFFCGWVREFAKHCEKVTVIAQGVGKYRMPENVAVHSLRKEEGLGRSKQVLRFWFLIWKHRSSYDAVFVHMVPIWVVLGCDSWILLRKRIYLWYEARGTRWPLRIALIVVRKIFSASPHGMPLRTKKSVITGHGIDGERFAFGTGERERGLLVSVGRITRAKRLDVLLRCLRGLPSEFHLTLLGALRTNEDHELLRELRSHVSELGLKSRVEISMLPPREVPLLLQRAEIFLHSSETSLDKALLEAMACGCLVVSSSEAAKSILPKECLCTDETMADTAQHLLSLPREKQDAIRTALRSMIVERHSLPRLIARLVQEMQS